MHPTQWEYIDEIEIMGMDGKIEGAVKVPAEQPRFWSRGSYGRDPESESAV